MFRTLILGLILGFFGAGSLLYFVPVVDQYRVPSHIKVLTNGGNNEVFSIQLPGDRIMSGKPGSASPVPPGLAWPDSPKFAGFEAELFKIRDSDDTVIGVGSRMVHAAASGGPFVQWVVHLPARGTMFVAMQPNPAPGRPRSGTLSAGTREFASLHGTVSEAFVRDGDGTETEGHIELRAALVGLQDDQP